MERLFAQQSSAISTAEKELGEFEDIETNYQQLKERLQNLPKKLRHTVSVPLNSMGFFQGELIHTNEITVLLSSDYLVQVSASKASEIVERRIEECRKRQEKAKEEIEHYNEWKKFTQRDLEEKTRTVDIKEDYDEAEELIWREQHVERVRQERRRAQQFAAKSSDPDDDDALWERLEELEIQEQLEKYSAENRSDTSTETVSSNKPTLNVEEASTSSQSHIEAKSILRRTPSTASFKSVHFEENSEPEPAMVVIDSDDDELKPAEDDVEEEAFTGLIVERDIAGSVVSSVGEPQIRLSRFKASKR